VKGLTIIELLVSISILTIILSSGWPNMQALVQKYQAQTAVATLKRIFIHARTTAFVAEKSVTVCPIKDHQCINDWSKPISVFTDKNSNKVVDTDEFIHFKAHVMVPTGYWQKKRASAPYVKFNPLGHAFSSATTFLYCPYSGGFNHARQLIINFQGRIRSQAYLSSRGTPYSRVSPLSCSHPE
jgi:type IV fimbrial biogenesis protein FimT